MYWIMGIYLAVGVVKFMAKLNAPKFYQPVWMITEPSGVTFFFKSVLYIVIWPLVGVMNSGK